MRRFILLMGVAAIMAVMAAASALPALAYPERQPSNGHNCIGLVTSHYAAFEEFGGIGNRLGGQNVKEAQEVTQAFCS